MSEASTGTPSSSARSLPLWRSIFCRPIFRGVLSVANAWLIGFFIFDRVFYKTRVVGRSMFPTLQPDDHLLVRGLSEKEDIRRGDVYILRSPEKASGTIVKRVVAIEGDTVVALTGHTVQIPKGFCWIEGDNSANSRDSNSYGPVPMSLIDGRVFYQIHFSPFHTRSISEPRPAPPSRVNVPTESPHLDSDFHFPPVGAFLETFNIYHS